MNIFLTMILAMLNILGWAYNPFLIKTLLKKISPLGFTILRGLLTLPIALIGTIFVRKEIFNKSEQFYILGFIVILISFFGSYINAFLLKRYNANIVSAIINPLVIFLSAIIGNLFYREPFTSQMWIGLIFILIGLIIFILGRKNIEGG